MPKKAFEWGLPPTKKRKQVKKKGGVERVEKNLLWRGVIPKNLFEGRYVTKTGKLRVGGSYHLQMTLPKSHQPHYHPHPYPIKNERSIKTNCKMKLLYGNITIFVDKDFASFARIFAF